MTLDQLDNLTEQEMAIILVVVNIIDPLECPKMQFEPRQLTWFRHEFLIKKLVNAFPKVLPEGRDIYCSLLKKLNYTLEIKQDEPKSESTGSTQLTGSV